MNVQVNKHKHQETDRTQELSYEEFSLSEIKIN